MKQFNGDFQNNETTENNEQLSLSAFNSEFNVKAKIHGYIILDVLDIILQKIDKTQYNALYLDIQSKGIYSPIFYIKIDNEKILVDGHVRLKIASELGIENIPSLEICEDFNSIDEVKIWMVRNQCQRRNLSKNIRLKMAYELKDSISELARKNLVLAGMKEEVTIKIDTLAEIAKIAGVSKATVARYQNVLENGTEEMKNRMIEGDISINNAYEQLQKNEPENMESSNLKKETIHLRQNYFKLVSVKEGTKMVKSGELDCILIIQKGKEALIADTEYKTGLVIIE